MSSWSSAAIVALIVGTLVGAGGALGACPNHVVRVARATGEFASVGRRPAMSSDGRFVAFVTSAKLATDDQNGDADIYVWNRETGALTRETLASDGSEVIGGGYSSLSLSADGRYLSFQSYTDLDLENDQNGYSDVYVRDRQEGVVRAWTDGAVDSPVLSSDANTLIFRSARFQPSQIVIPRAPRSCCREVVSVNTDGDPGNDDSDGPLALSAVGDRVVFASRATDLLAQSYDATGLFVRSRSPQFTRSVGAVLSEGPVGNGPSTNPSISGNGEVVVFQSQASNLVDNDNNSQPDVFAWHVDGADPVECLSLVRTDPFAPIETGNGASFDPVVSFDGSFVVFRSRARLVGDKQGTTADVFLRDRGAGRTFRISEGLSPGEDPDGDSGPPVISADGRFVAFISAADNLCDDDDGSPDLFLIDRSKATPASSTSTSTSTSTTIRPDVPGEHCGNGMVEPERGEQCDDGNPLAQNDCCDSNCQARVRNHPCGNRAEDLCDRPDICDGAGVCLPNREPEGTPCGRGVGDQNACDPGETCDGRASGCPFVDPEAGCDVEAPSDVVGKEAAIGCFAPDTVANKATVCEAIGTDGSVPSATAQGRAAGESEVVTKRAKIKVRQATDGQRRKILKLRLNVRGKRLLGQRAELPVNVVVKIRHGRTTRELTRVIRFLRKG